MLTILSPAKTLDYSVAATDPYSFPDYIAQAQTLVAQLQPYSPDQLAQLMRLSDKLAGLNMARYATWTPEHHTDNARQALFAFKGQVYQGLAAATLDHGALDFAQQHLRILSGLYGILRPLDLIQPHRLEMSTRLVTSRGKNLYAFWREWVTQALNSALADQGDDLLLNLASNEYAKVIDLSQLRGHLIQVEFREYRHGQYRIVSIHTKRARGLMARYIIDHRLQTPKALLDFDQEGYGYHAALSSAERLVFTRRN